MFEDEALAGSFKSAFLSRPSRTLLLDVALEWRYAMDCFVFRPGRHFLRGTVHDWFQIFDGEGVHMMTPPWRTTPGRQDLGEFAGSCVEHLDDFGSCPGDVVETLRTASVANRVVCNAGYFARVSYNEDISAVLTDWNWKCWRRAAAFCRLLGGGLIHHCVARNG